nr:MAG TPA: hypothetical protein [Caudoviricetes sp.]
MVSSRLRHPEPRVDSFAWLQVIVRHIFTSRFDIYRLPVFS